jgi:hypothetical protein
LKRARACLLIVALGAIAIAFFGARPPQTPGPALRDFESYYAAGATWHYEGDPYGRDVWRVEKGIPGVLATRDELLPFVGPPFGLPFWSALSRLPWPSAVLVWDSVLGLAVAALVLASLRIAGGPLRAFDIGAAAIVAVGFGPLTSGVALGQVAIVACAAIALVPFTLGPRLLVAAFCAALAAALQPNLALVLAARLGGLRSWLAFGCATAVALFASALTLGGPAGFAHYVDVLRAHGASERFIAIQTTPAAVARALGASASAAGSAALLLALCVVGIVLWQCLRGSYAPNARLALASAALPLALPFAHEHDFTLVFLPAILVARTARGPTWLVGACGILLVATDWLGLAQRRDGALETALLTFAAALGLALLAPDLRPAYLAPALLGPVVLVVCALVATHPLPIWPDGLGATFHVSHALLAPEVWRREQEVSGVARLDPVWGALRLISLAGCALVWFAASIALRTPAVPTDAERRSATA